jgi:hypothetical protein
MVKHTFQEMLNAYWLTHQEVSERVNLVLAERGQKYVYKRGKSTLIDIATGQVLDDDVSLRLLAIELDVVKDGEIYAEPPIDCGIRDGKLFSWDRSFFKNDIQF